MNARLGELVSHFFSVKGGPPRSITTEADRVILRFDGETITSLYGDKSSVPGSYLPPNVNEAICEAMHLYCERYPLPQHTPSMHSRSYSSMGAVGPFLRKR